jgi:dolichyl-phosphate-mannose-protein mannosyltransferase
MTVKSSLTLAQYAAYNTVITDEVLPISAVPSSADPNPDLPVAEVFQPQAGHVEEPKNDQVISEQAVVSPPPEGIPKDLPIVSKEERIEYRDENGRILDEEEVAALAGKVSFKTRYETRTRVVDGQGNEIYEGLVNAHGDEEDEPQGVAPPHPDVEGQNPETQQGEPAQASDAPPTVEVVEDQKKEQSAEQDERQAKPASEGQAATDA